jgi:hypothetical protein
MSVIDLAEMRRRRPHIEKRIPMARCPKAAFGLEALDFMGIDIDQDPTAFAKFLELKNHMQAEAPDPGLRMARQTL